jgi:NAD(P)-dependent dehydrogenase (short-subunit alcohol dehydrogenase family)
MPDLARQPWFLVTGGSGGIGSAVCRGLAERGYKPLVGYQRDEATACRLAEQTGGMPLHLDLREARSIDEAAARLEQLPRLAGAVLAACAPLSLAPFGKISLDELELHWRISVLGNQRLLAELVRRCFRKHKAGAVVGVLSAGMGGEHDGAAPGMGAYTIGKHGMAGVLALAAADYPWLRVRSVKPGYTETKMLVAFDDRFLQMQREKAAFQTPELVAGLILQEALQA